MKDEALRQEICKICHLLYDRGYVVTNDGNVSARTERGTVLITPSGVGKGRIEPNMLVEIDLEGNILSGDRYPSSEHKMHLLVYRERSDVMAVVHAHPAMSTAFSICRQGLTKPYLVEMVAGLGEIPVTEFAMPSTDEVPQSVLPFVHDHTAVLLANHGALTWGPSLLAAFDRLEVVEQTAKVFFYVHQLGGGMEIDRSKANQLMGMGDFYAKLAGKREE